MGFRGLLLYRVPGPCLLPLRRVPGPSLLRIKHEKEKSRRGFIVGVFFTKPMNMTNTVSAGLARTLYLIPCGLRSDPFLTSPLF